MTETDFATENFPGDELHRALSELRHDGPVARAKFAGETAWIILGYAELAQAFRDGDSFPPPLMYRMALEPAIGRSFISMDEDEHRVYRQLATPAFRARAVARIGSDGIDTIVGELLDRLPAEEEIDLVETLTARFPHLVICRMLGIPRDREEEFHRWALALLGYSSDQDAATRASAEFTGILEPLLEARRRDPRDDVLSELVYAEVDGRKLTDEEVLSHIRLLFPTGGETTQGALGSLVYELARREDLWSALRKDRGGRGAAIEELLRFEPPTAVLPRRSGADGAHLGGIEISPDRWVLFAMAAANRDPAVFAKPDLFDISRAPNEHLSFGPGLRTCPGMHLARRNLAVALDMLLERFDTVELCNEAASRPAGTGLRGPVRLPVKLHPS